MARMRGWLVRVVAGCVAGVVGLCVPCVAFAHYDRAYWHEEEASTRFVEQYQSWMETVPDGRRLGEISVPGTHDSMAYGGWLPFNDIVRTQSMSLRDQLDSGIRYVDIRLSYEGDRFDIYHGDVHLGSSFDDVLDTVSEFLGEFPSETVLMRVKQEHSRVSDEAMWELFDAYDRKYPGLLWDRSLNETNNPTIGQVRGKVVVLSDIWGLPQGISYAMLPKQDNYHVASNWGVYDKWLDIKAEIDRVDASDGSWLRVNHLSASGGAFPYFVASGHSSPSTYGSRLATGYTTPGFSYMYPDFPRVAPFLGVSSIVFEGMNTLTADYLAAQGVSSAGIVVADFPGERLIDAVIQCNYR